MYTSFYNLKIKPFQISSDPDFMWFGEKHKEALATLKYGVLDNKGFLLLTGDVGTGKTTLINTLLQSLSDDILCASVSDPGLSKLDFFNFIASSFGIDQEFLTKGSFLIGFRKFLFNAYDENKKVLLIIDEAQLLTQELLEEIRLLSNIEKTNTKLINIFFVGQNEFNEIVNQDKNRAVRQRLTLNYNLDPLTPDETQKYIEYRLKVAGADRTIFDSQAVQEVFMYSGGFPRRINVICDHALLSGYVSDSEKITAQIVQECAKELKIPAHIQNRDINGFGSQQSEHVAKVQSKPVNLQPRTPEKRKKAPVNIIIFVIAVFLFSIMCWWILFPANFQQFISNTYSQAEVLKNRTFKLLPVLPELSDSAQLSVPVPEQLPEQLSDKTEAVEQSRDKKKISLQTENKADNNNLELLQDEKTIETSALLVENNFEEKRENKDLSDSQVKQSTVVPEETAEILKEKIYNPLIQSFDTDKEVLPLPEETIIIRFQYNTNDFTEQGLNKLEEFADIIVAHADAKILVGGYTDSNGNQQYNKKLSEFRANIVRSFLLGRGISVEQIKVIGFGSVDPVESNDTAWGRMMNRRVEIKVVQ